MILATELQSALRTLIALLAILNPIGAIPIFIALTNDETVAQRRATAKMAARAVAVVLIVAAFLGDYILQFFGISIAAFQVAGGMVLMLLAFNMLQAKSSRYRHTPEEAAEGMQKEAVAVVPLAIPLLAGPGTMVTVIIAHNKNHGWLADGLLVLDILIIALVAYAALRLAEPLTRRLGVTGINITTRIFGLILAAIAVTFLANGLSTLFPGLHAGVLG
ncbi:MAG: NAAT family transporter [Acidithiobacillus sp.]|nr:NAAT family transporter [Acidithiobacillus sp.]